jgi:serine/threonine protein kinase
MVVRPLRTSRFTAEGTATCRFRRKIAFGAARALAFLHHGCIRPQIFHQDMKGSNICFDYGREPKLSDFGLSKIAGTSTVQLHHSLGYAPAEFSGSENDTATAKSDLYSFDIVLLEPITGNEPLCGEQMNHLNMFLLF